MARDLYSVLGVNKSATQNEIKAAYRELAKKLHPDLNPGNKEAERKFKEVNEAYAILSDPKEREHYDHLGESPFAEGPAPEGQRTWRQGPFYYETQSPGGGKYSQSFSFEGGDLGDLFGSILGKRGARRREFGQEFDIFDEEGAPSGQIYSLEIDLRDAVLGAEREVTLPDGQRLRIKIPPGVDSGTRFRVPAGGGGRETYFEIVVRPSPVFKRVGNDLEVEVPISFPEAVLGTELKVPVIDGEVMVNIPPGVTTGTKLRLRGKGLPSRRGGKPGDQIIILKVIMPTQIDSDLRELVEKWNKTHSYDPRINLWNEVRKERHRAA